VAAHVLPVHYCVVCLAIPGYHNMRRYLYALVVGTTPIAFKFYIYFYSSILGIHTVVTALTTVRDAGRMWEARAAQSKFWFMCILVKC
jgi:hypothetical protein